MPKATLILPSLNVGGYIGECLESVRCQSLEDIEILCIDAGSTDGTYEILQEYAKRDSRIRLIHSEVKSYGHQVNLGLAMAQGEYVGIVETDDYVVPEMYEELYQAATEQDLDFAKAGFDVFVTPSAGERYLLNYPMADCGQIISADYFLDRKLSQDIYIWNGLYKMSFLRKYNIHLNESPGAAFQDCGMRYMTDMNLTRGMFLDRSFYRYRRDNVASSTYSADCVRYNLEECRYLRRQMEKNGLQDDRRRAFAARESVMMALEPYRTFRGCHDPGTDILPVLEAFREIIRKDRAEGLLRQEDMLSEHWQEMRLFTEAPQAFESYITINAQDRYAPYRKFLGEMAKKEQIILFCAGNTARYALCFMRLNGIDTIQAVCDNNSALWGKKYYGYEVLPPQEAVRRYAKAHYLIANTYRAKEIKKQLLSIGIQETDLSVYPLPLRPMESTNCFLKIYDTYDPDENTTGFETGPRQ
jgi:glycosyltransferase involved in cell wall biosynthesis